MTQENFRKLFPDFPAMINYYNANEDNSKNGNKPGPDIDNGTGGEDDSGKLPKPDPEDDDNTDSDKPTKEGMSLLILSSFDS